jgi:hypothetical protein
MGAPLPALPSFLKLNILIQIVSSFKDSKVALPDNETAEDASQLGSFGGIAVSPPSFQKGSAAISVPHPPPILVDT